MLPPYFVPTPSALGADDPLPGIEIAILDVRGATGSVSGAGAGGCTG